MAERITTDTPKIGVDLARVFTGAADPQSEHRLGAEVLATDGRRYVFALADDTITTATTTCDIDTTTFKVANTGGTYKSPVAAMAKGDRGWFSKPSV